MRKAAFLTILALGGCVSDHPRIRPLHPLEIATAPYDDVAGTPLTGTLMYEGGCLIFRDEKSRVLLTPVMPTGSSFNGSALLFHLPGKSDQWVAVNQEVLLYGEPISWSALADEAPVQRQCGAFSPFFVSAVRPAD